MDTQTLFSRRDVLKGLGAMGALSFVALMGGCEELIEIIENRPVRRDISKLSLTDPIIQTFQAAVTAMKSLHPTDQRNWSRQAQIHYDHCPHGNWYFLPWHRAYLLAFEQICRKLTGNSDFALPYWNWTANPSVPAAFWGDGNPLYDVNRDVTATTVADPNFVGPSIVDSILNEPNFFLFASSKVTGQRDFGNYGRLENTPHNYIHSWIDNLDMGSYWSPRDPVFWAHHNMIECCWIEWNIERHHPNTNDPQWMNFQFNGDFCDPNGSPINVSIFETLLYPLLSYRYEPCKPQVGAGPSKHLSHKEAKALVKFVKHGAKVHLDFLQRYVLQTPIEIAPGRPASATIKLEHKHFHDALVSESNRRLILTLGGVELPDQADYFIRVFVDKPEASTETPLDDPHYAGSFAIFFDESAHHHGSEPPTSKPGYIVDVGEALRRLNRAGSLSAKDQVSVQLIPVPFPNRRAKPNRFSARSLELGILKVTK